MTAADLYRSKTMSYCKLTTNFSQLRPLLNNLFQKDCIQFVDENENVPLFSRKFSKEIAKIGDVE